ncbi:MAG: reverse transcriptase-like protein [Bacteroidia bacterium]
MLLEIFCDGSCWNATIPQPMGLGISYFIGGKHLRKRDKAIEVSVEEAGGHSTSVMAELLAIKAGMESIPEITESYSRIIIRSDNEFAIKVSNGVFSTKLPHLIPIIEKIKSLIVPGVTVEWVSRNFNRESDDLSRRALGKAVRNYETTKFSAELKANPEISYTEFKQNLLKAASKIDKDEEAIKLELKLENL